MQRLNARTSTIALAALSFIVSFAIPRSAFAADRVTEVVAAPRAAPRAINFICSDSKDAQVMIDVDGTFAHRDNTWKSPEIGRLLKFQCYVALGRDANSEWILFPFGNSQAWVHRSAVRFKDGEDIFKLPPANPSAPKPVTMRLPGIPTVSKNIKLLYKQAVKSGRNPGAVTVIGDCNSEHPVFFGRLAAGVVNLAADPKVQKTAQLFASSFKRPSVATSGSFSAAMAFDPTWADPEQCQANEGPLACELRLSNASIAMISLGTGDTFTWQDFEHHYRTIIDYALANKVVPILMTKADALEQKQGGAPVDHINNVVRRLGAAYGLPVIDFALAAKTLPKGGLIDERNLNSQTIDPFHVNEIGMDARILMTLHTLAQITSK
jgi:hypothetical protein